MAAPIRLAIIDDHNIVVEGISSLFEKEPGYFVVAEGYTGADAVSISQLYTYDVMLMDLNLPDMQGLDAAMKILALHPEHRILALTMNESLLMVRDCIQAGMRGYVLKNSMKDELLNAVRDVAHGKLVLPEGISEASLEEDPESEGAGSIEDILTKRERQVLERILHEETTPEIAETLGLSPLTVETHRKNLLHKLGVKNTAGLVKLVISRGFGQ